MNHTCNASSHRAVFEMLQKFWLSTSANGNAKANSSDQNQSNVSMIQSQFVGSESNKTETPAGYDNATAQLEADERRFIAGQPGQPDPDERRYSAGLPGHERRFINGRFVTLRDGTYYVCDEFTTVIRRVKKAAQQ